MTIKKVWAIYFSPTGNAKKVAITMARSAARMLDVHVDTYDFTLPENRAGVNEFEASDLVFFVMPTYAGRLPNKMLPYVQSGFSGNGALAVPVVVYGNRSFDGALMELRNELESHGFHTIAAAGIPTEHVFSSVLGTGRPDESDLVDIANFGEEVARKISDMNEIPERIDVPGDDFVSIYYTPLGTDGKPAFFLKAKPVTDTAICTRCGACVSVCPMGSIPADAPYTCTGICIKCQACIKVCQQSAKHMEDAAFLSHVEMLKQNYTQRKEVQWFI